MKFPLPPQEPLTDGAGHVTNAWYRAFLGLKPTVRNVTAGTSTGTPDGDAIVFVVQAGPLAPTTLQLSSSPTLGQTLVVKDAFGSASINPITLLPPVGVLIDGAEKAAVDTDYGFLSVSWNGVGWSIIGAESIGPTGPTGAIGLHGATGPTGPTGP